MNFIQNNTTKMDIIQKQVLITSLVSDLNRIKDTLYKLGVYNEMSRVQDFTSHVRFRLKMKSIVHKQTYL